MASSKLETSSKALQRDSVPTIWSFLVETRENEPIQAEVDKSTQDVNAQAAAVASEGEAVNAPVAQATEGEAAVATAPENAQGQETKAAEGQTESAKAPENTGTHQEHVKEALELLYIHFPKAFIKDGDCKPLKIGILEDLKPLIANIEGLSISKVRAAVRIYTTRLRYFYSVREGAMRVDLNGQEIDAVTAEHAEYARTRFSEINALRPAKPKKPQNHRSFNKNGKRPFNKDGNGKDGQRRGGFNKGGQQGGFKDRKFEAAKASDIRVGRYVFVSIDSSYHKGTVAEEIKGDKVSVTLMNGSTTILPLDRIFIGHGGQGQKRNFNNNNRGGGNFRNNRNNNGYRNNGPRNQGNGDRPPRDNKGSSEH